MRFSHGKIVVQGFGLRNNTLKYSRIFREYNPQREHTKALIIIRLLALFALMPAVP